MKYNTRKAMANIKHALNKIQKEYYGNPLYLINERDAQSMIYAELFNFFNTPRGVKVQISKNKHSVEISDKVKTIPLHAELYQNHRKGKVNKKWKGRFVDLGIILNYESLIITKKHKGKGNRTSFYGKPDWYPENAIGIEIKFNDWCFKETREKQNKKWQHFCYMVEKDLSKLNDYKRGIFVLVDREGVFSSNSDWWRFVRDLIPKSKKNRRYQTIRAYCLSPLSHKIYSYGTTG